MLNFFATGLTVFAISASANYYPQQTTYGQFGRYGNPVHSHGH